MLNFRLFLLCILQKVLGAPKFVKIVPKLGISTDHYQALIGSESRRDTSTCKISWYSPYVFCRKCPSGRTNRWLVGQLGNGPSDEGTIPAMHSPESARSPQICQNCAKIRNINRPLPSSNRFWKSQGYINMQNLMIFPLCVLQEMPIRTDKQMVGWPTW